MVVGDQGMLVRDVEGALDPPHPEPPLFLLGSLLVSAKQHRLAPSTGAHGLTWAHNRGDWQQGEQSRRAW